MNTNKDNKNNNNNNEETIPTCNSDSVISGCGDDPSDVRPMAVFIHRVGTSLLKVVSVIVIDVAIA